MALAATAGPPAREGDGGLAGRGGRVPDSQAHHRLAPPAPRVTPRQPASADPDQVLIADDNSLVRAGFESVLSIESDVTVVGEARNGAEAVALARDEAPDVVLMDIRMPEMDGLEATRLITSDPRLRRIRVVVLTAFDLDEYVFGALQAGASGFLLKGAELASAGCGP
jgi:CheY-like chemotaxis protein